MRFALVNQFFWPDAAATSQLLTDLAEGLVAEGHAVEAISASTRYAESDQGKPPAGVTMHRVRSFAFSRKATARLASYLSFYTGAAWRLLTMPRPDVVITLTTPPLLSVLGNIAKCFRGSRHFIWEMDLYPDIAVDLGYIPAGGIVDTLMGRLARISRNFADGIVALGECMKSRIVSRGTPAAKIVVVQNWADSHAIVVEPRQTTDAKLRLLYSGNLGLAHDIDTLLNAMPLLDDRIHVRFTGGGARLQEVRDRLDTTKRDGVEFTEYEPRTSLSASFGWCDIGLVMQSSACCGSVVPSKLYGLLAAGRPVLFIGPSAATPAQVVRENRCGWQVNCSESGRLAELLAHLLAHPGEVEQAGRNAREILVQSFDRSIGVQRIVRFVSAPDAPAAVGVQHASRDGNVGRE